MPRRGETASTRRVKARPVRQPSSVRRTTSDHDRDVTFTVTLPDLPQPKRPKVKNKRRQETTFSVTLPTPDTIDEPVTASPSEGSANKRKKRNPPRGQSKATSRPPKKRNPQNHTNPDADNTPASNGKRRRRR